MSGCLVYPVVLCVGSEHQPVDGGAGPADVQRSTVCSGHREPDESGGWKVKGGLGKPAQSKSKGVSGNRLSVTFCTAPHVLAGAFPLSLKLCELKLRIANIPNRNSSQKKILFVRLHDGVFWVIR